MGKVAGFELNSQDTDKATEFYSNVFGWEVSEPSRGYCTVSTGGISGGITKGPHDLALEFKLKSILLMKRFQMLRISVLWLYERKWNWMIFS
ncbi:VOC family protein [Paenibacillus sp. NPDC056579]|uniref:VOC family protein n=1 Tax=Paenibacillus sp. NPDC056579 TaxID=3345871 RepID=UPI0036A3D1D7